MNWKSLFLSADGRIGQKDFWIGYLILLVAGFVLGMIPVLGMLVGLALIYPSVCIFTKRLHDFGKTGWLQLAPIAIFVVLGVIAAVVGGGAAALTGAGDEGLMAVMATMGLFLLVMAAVALGFLLWVGLSKGDLATNQYGPPPVALTGTAATV